MDERRTAGSKQPPIARQDSSEPQPWRDNSLTESGAQLHFAVTEHAPEQSVCSNAYTCQTFALSVLSFWPTSGRCLAEQRPPQLQAGLSARVSIFAHIRTNYYQQRLPPCMYVVQAFRKILQLLQILPRWPVLPRYRACAAKKVSADTE